jgi:hypothetical protein
VYRVFSEWNYLTSPPLFKGGGAAGGINYSEWI